MDPEDINYKIRFIEKSNEKYFDKVTEITMAKKSVPLQHKKTYF